VSFAQSLARPVLREPETERRLQTPIGRGVEARNVDSQVAQQTIGDMRVAQFILNDGDGRADGVDVGRRAGGVQIGGRYDGSPVIVADGEPPADTFPDTYDEYMPIGIPGGRAPHLWLDAEHAKWLQERVAELRHPPHNFHVAPDERLEAWLQEALRSRGTVELLVALYRVVKPALLEAYRAHHQQTNPLVDHPTRRILRFIIQEEEEMIQWGEAALEALVEVGIIEANLSAEWARDLLQLGGHRHPRMVLNRYFATTSPVKHNLPQRLKAFVPRNDEIPLVERRLAEL